MRVAALYTCHNRKEKTLSSINSLYRAIDWYEIQTGEVLDLEIFLTDDGCTDCTVDAVRERFGDGIIHVVQGDGQLFWAGGMRLAWNEAQRRCSEWDYYLLLNDDTVLYESVIEELLLTEEYCIKKYGRNGLVSGLCHDRENHSAISYGGEVFVNKFLGRYAKAVPSESPMLIDMCNANILLVPQATVNQIGIFYEGYNHAYADYDYSLKARQQKIPVLLTAKICGSCTDDHDDRQSERRKVCQMSYKQRKEYYRNPLHSNKDYLTFIKRNIPVKFPFTCLFRTMNVLCPRLYYLCDSIRR